jgi:signal transduction histidine kinase
MAERAGKIGAQDLSARLPVVNPRDELGLLARTFNDLLDRLEASLTQQRQFMADASHELRTPVTTTRTAAAVALQQPHRDEQEYRETLAIVEQQTTRLSRIVEDMFTLARADAGSYPMRMAPMYLDELVEEVVRAARVIAATRQVTIELRTPQSAAFTGDEDLVRRLIANLVDNAVRHARVSGLVRIALEHREDSYSITVSDDGPGISPEAQPHIFERFYRGDPARTATDGGAGLGLALARWTAREHGGDVRLVSSSAQGTTFSVHLPFMPRSLS